MGIKKRHRSGEYFDTDPRICAAGISTSARDGGVSDCMKRYTLQDEVDALMSDAVFPAKSDRLPGTVTNKKDPDRRNYGVFTVMRDTMFPIKSKFEQIVDDLKETTYSSYWKKGIGITKDMVPMLPEGMKWQNVTFGKKTACGPRLYDVVFPPCSCDQKASEEPGTQQSRKYCIPSFPGKDAYYGMRYNYDPRGQSLKCAMRDDRVKYGQDTHFVSSKIEADFNHERIKPIGQPLNRYENWKNVPEGHFYAKLSLDSSKNADVIRGADECPQRKIMLRCMKHINTLRIVLNKRDKLAFSFQDFYENLKFKDKDNSGWLHRDLVYRHCAKCLIRFDPNLVEPLLDMWDLFKPQTKMIQYKGFVDILNPHKDLPSLPQVRDLPSRHCQYSTTYADLIYTCSCDANDNTRRPTAGVISPDPAYKQPKIIPFGMSASKQSLPDESNVKTCIEPSIMTLYGVNHRDFFCKRTPEEIRRIFKARGSEFTDEEFSQHYESAKKFSCSGDVSVETFRWQLDGIPKKPPKIFEVL